ncbi:MAG TPA: GMC family oxidoreductase [Kofleriaceae bacterium]|nr:GMC family oxidoreductase [Kofleriaceae bacterium]
MAVTAPRPAFFQDRKPRNVFSREDLDGDTSISCDVVIVGSGAGGATMAAELAEGGLDVVVLEEGRYYSTRDFTADASAAVRALYRDGGATMALGSPPVLYQEGTAVGGSTVINGGMSWRTPEKILERWYREDGLDHIRAADMELYFERVERRLHVRHQDPESIGHDNELLKIGADRMGWKVIPNLRNQVHCPGSNNCAFGCPTGAKQSALVTYIPRALHFGARIYSDLRVDKVTRLGKRATGVTARVVREDRSLGARVTVHAKLVVLAAGAMYSPYLLMQSGFRSRSGRLGRDLSLHPNTKLIAIFDEDVRGWEGVHQAYQVREFQDEGFLFAAVNIPPGIIGMTTPHYGAELGELMRDYDKMVVAGMLVEDTNTGRLRNGPMGKPIATYQLSDFDADKLKRGTALLSELLFAAGAKRIILPFAGAGELHGPDDVRKIFANPVPKSSMEVVTVHLMGTARMGADPTRAVVDPYGHVYDADRLVVSDASVFPSPIGVNPMETIMALSTRSAAHILDNQRRFVS